MRGHIGAAYWLGFGHAGVITFGALMLHGCWWGALLVVLGSCCIFLPLRFLLERQAATRGK